MSFLVDCMANKRPWDALDDLLIVKSGRVRILTILLILISTVGTSSQSPRDAEIEDLLKKLNKQPTKTLQSLDGEIIDCVDIYKQLAFDHPLLKNHTIEMRPSFDPEMVDRSNYSSEYAEPIWRLNGSCPEGTIPIRRVTKSDLLRAKTLKSFGTVNPNPYTARTDRLEVACGFMQSHYPMYHGVEGDVSVWKPWVDMVETTTSSINICMVNGGPNFKHSIHLGWMVMAHMFGDDEPRTFVAWMAREGNNIKGCHNLFCPGFVQRSREFVLGLRLPVSRIGGPLMMLRLQIKKSPLNNWWVKINGVNVGYYPSEIFPDFDQANIVDWRGEVVNKMNLGLHTVTQMGSSRFAHEGHGRAAHFENMMYADHYSRFHPARNLQIDVSFPRCYNAILHPPPSETSGPSLFFGGPGGMHCDREPSG